jgi:hypothetical protein
VIICLVLALKAQAMLIIPPRRLQKKSLSDTMLQVYYFTVDNYCRCGRINRDIKSIGLNPCLGTIIIRPISSRLGQLRIT